MLIPFLQTATKRLQPLCIRYTIRLAEATIGEIWSDRETWGLYDPLASIGELSAELIPGDGMGPIDSLIDEARNEVFGLSVGDSLLPLLDQLQAKFHGLVTQARSLAGRASDMAQLTELVGVFGALVSIEHLMDGMAAVFGNSEVIPDADLHGLWLRLST